MNGLSLRELECFTAVAEELSFTAAARRLHLSQPPLSRHIASLEGRLGCRLFARTKRSVQLTDAGRLYLAETRGVLPQLVRAEATVREFASNDGGRVAIGFVSALLSAPLVELFERFHRLADGTQVTLHDLTPSAQLDGIREGSLDLGFIGLAPHARERGVALWPWHSERLCAIVSSGHPLAARQSVPVEMLRAESLVFVSNQAAPAFASRLHAVCAAAGFCARVVQEASRAQAVAMMAIAGSSVALLPESVAGIVPGACARPVIDRKGSEILLDFVVASASRPGWSGRSFLRTAGIEIDTSSDSDVG